MKCSDAQQILPEFVDGAPEGALPVELQSHLNSCPDCSNLVSDLQAIASSAGELAESDEPAPRVWLQIAAQLRSEGIIREPEPEPVPARPIFVPAPARRGWSAWWLAPVAAAVLAAGAFVLGHQSSRQIAKHEVPAAPAVATATTQVAAVPVAPETAAAKPAPASKAKQTAVVASNRKPEVEPEASLDDQRFLSEVSTRAPSMRASCETQLRAVNANIREVQEYLQRNPGDVDARQQLMDAYQQKALLYQIALDRIQ